ncbi:MAG: DNA polymerase [Oscillochloris sp.]|nr:DNA polymerase [Oscillochloris sp.]
MTDASTIAEWVYGWNPTPAIVSVWADREGQALIWRRVADRTLLERVAYRPWLLATHCDDLQALGDGPLHADEHAPLRVRTLDGPPGSLRFLIDARSGRILEQTLRDGAARRLGRPVESLGDLGAYYRLGPVEQYLIASGQVSYRGMIFSDLRRLQFDLETTALDPAEGRIFMVAVRDTAGLATTIEAPQPQDEPGLIRQLCGLIAERDPDLIENHNLFGFDLPFLEARARALRVPLALGRAPLAGRLERFAENPRGRRWRYSIAGRELLDTLDAVRRHNFVARDLDSQRLKDVARAFGIARPERVYIPGAEVFNTYLADQAQARAYALDDVAEVDALSLRLHAAPFALAGMAPRRFERVAWAGPAMGILEPMLIRAYVRAGMAPPAPPHQRSGRGGHSGGATFLFAGGLARNVVKADIASLYPSLMRTFRIGPACDRLGALLGIVEHLLDARLGHKLAARNAAPGSVEAGHHHALQAAMKLIINAAYGYMGADTMALFADMEAADEVTRRGRAVLDTVIGGLRARGVTLLEADTDGVYFAVPDGWDAAREQALVAEVGAELPAGIILEYEGRYAAMFSHEVKNYALLGYDDRLILRGVAFRSSRAEPFCERFLALALRLTMAGDVVGLQAHFAQALADLRARRVDPHDLAGKVRLSKTPERYRAARQRESAYEALLAAGRTTWTPGERVRFYRAEGGGAALLPDEEAPERGAYPPYDIEHYVRVLLESYAGRLRKAFRKDDFAQIFRTDIQLGLFDRDIGAIAPQWISGEERRA